MNHSAKRCCDVADCNNFAESRGWCNKHYKRWQAHGDPTITRLGKTLNFADRNPTQSELRALLDYDPETGAFRWRSREEVNGWIRAWNLRNAGRIAGVVEKGSGYTRVTIGDKIFLAHRLAVIWMLGDIPPDVVVDHANRVTSDNRWANLRIATHTENQANRKAQVRPKHPGLPKGVAKVKGGRFVAAIKSHHKARYLGTFSTPEEAHAAYIKAARSEFGEFARAS